MRIESSIPPVRPVVIVRRVLACDPISIARPYLLPRLCGYPIGCGGRGSIPFSRYLQKHNRQDRDDLSRNAIPQYADAPATRLGDILDVEA
jgi:hypothetical protein